MQLRINTINNDILANLENILYSDDRNIAKWFMQNLPGEVYENLSPQYELQVISGMQIRKMLGGNVFKNIKGIYFGTEQCEFLLPTVEETKKAVELMKEFDKKYTSKEIKRFVFVTPYYGNAKIRERIIANLKYLNDNANYINPKSKTVEVAVNDLGTIKLIKDYPNLQPILGRLLVKTLKNPIVDTLGLDKNVHVPGEMIKNKSKEEINEAKKKIADKQRLGMTRSALNNKYFQNLLKKYNIERAGIDYQENSSSLFDTQNIIDIYYPYALIYIGRLCDTSAIDNIKRGYYPIDEMCPRTCWKYDLFMKNFETVGYKLLYRGNAGYKSQVELDLDPKVVDVYENRLVYTPFI